MKFKTFSGILLVFFVLCTVMPFSAHAFSSDQPIKVGYYPNDDMVFDIDNFGSVGYGYDVMRKIEEVSDLNFEFVEVKGDIFEALKSGEVDVIGLYFRTEERLSEYLYLDTPFNAVQMSLATKSEVNLPYDEPGIIDGSTVATYEGNYANQLLDAYLAENNISVKYIMGDLPSYREIEADYYLVYSSDQIESNYQMVLNLQKRQTYLISNYGNEEMMDAINDALHLVITQEGDFFEYLAQKYSTDSLHQFHRGLTTTEIELLRQRPFKVAYELAHRPLSYTDSAGVEAGAIIDLMNELVEIYGFDVEYYPYVAADPSTIPSDCDIVVSAIGDSDYIEQHFTPTQSYYQMPTLAIVPRDKAIALDSNIEILLSSPKIGILKYLYSDFDALSAYASENELIFYDTFESLLTDYENQVIDLAVFTESGTTYANSYLKKAEHYSFVTDFELSYRFSISNDIADTYVPIFNVMFDNVPQVTYEEILMRHTSQHFYEPTLTDTIKDNWYYFAIVLLIVTAGYIILHVNGQIKKKEALLKSYNTDPLTGLVALPRFRQLLDEVLADAKPNEYELISMDIDMFKTINTHFSPERGTELICAIADGLKRALEGTSAIICRRTADQFLILRKKGDGGGIKQIYKIDIVPKIESTINKRYKVNLCFGCVNITDNKEKATAIIGYADSARLSGKQLHKTTFTEFDSKMRKLYEDKINITFRMEQALSDKEFVVEYQPKIDVESLTIGGVEALVRWHPKLGGKIYPDEFIPVFEANGFIASLDLYVLDLVCKDISDVYRKRGTPRISVNLSAHTILADGIVNRISDILDIHKVMPSEIEFELTESAVESDPERFLAVVKQLKKLGYYISIDDFGAGVSSLNRLSAVDADVLKLDKAFFDLKDQGGKSNVVVTDIINMAKNLDMQVVAEGVETYAQAVWLKSLGCDYVQGYYFERPMSDEDFMNLLDAKKRYELKP